MKEEEKKKGDLPQRKYGYFYEWNDEIDGWKRVHRKIVPKAPEKKREESEDEEKVTKIAFPHIRELECALGMKIQFTLALHGSKWFDPRGQDLGRATNEWHYGITTVGFQYKSVRVSKVSN